MATDPRKLRPSELCRWLNSTLLGEVINERQLHRHRTRAGMRIGDARSRASQPPGSSHKPARPPHDAGEMDGQRGRILRKGGLLARFKG